MARRAPQPVSRPSEATERRLGLPDLTQGPLDIGSGVRARWWLHAVAGHDIPPESGSQDTRRAPCSRIRPRPPGQRHIGGHPGTHARDGPAGRDVAVAVDGFASQLTQKPVRPSRGDARRAPALRPAEFDGILAEAAVLLAGSQPAQSDVGIDLYIAPRAHARRVPGNGDRRGLHGSHRARGSRSVWQIRRLRRPRRVPTTVTRRRRPDAPGRARRRRLVGSSVTSSAARGWVINPGRTPMAAGGSPAIRASTPTSCDWARSWPRGAAEPRPPPPSAVGPEPSPRACRGISRT